MKWNELLCNWWITNDDVTNADCEPLVDQSLAPVEPDSLCALRAPEEDRTLSICHFVPPPTRGPHTATQSKTLTVLNNRWIKQGFYFLFAMQNNINTLVIHFNHVTNLTTRKPASWHWRSSQISFWSTSCSNELETVLRAFQVC